MPDHSNLLLLLRLLVAHSITDFVLQKRSWSEEKIEKGWASPRLYLHGVVAGVLCYLFAAAWSAWWLPLIIGASHVCFDGLKSRFRESSLAFLVDQFAHLLVISVCWILLIDLTAADVIRYFHLILSKVQFWLVLLLYLLVIWPSGICIGSITRSWREEIQKDNIEGLERAGFWIGALERVLIVTFVLLSRYEAIGFLIAAKSIFRFGDIRSSESRKQTEYILIGTMISFLIAIILGIAAQWVIKNI